VEIVLVVEEEILEVVTVLVVLVVLVTEIGLYLAVVRHEEILLVIMRILPAIASGVVKMMKVSIVLVIPIELVALLVIVVIGIVVVIATSCNSITGNSKTCATSNRTASIST